jgi:hypothetical protein
VLKRLISLPSSSYGAELNSTIPALNCMMPDIPAVALARTIEVSAHQFPWPAGSRFFPRIEARSPLSDGYWLVYA